MKNLVLHPYFADARAAGRKDVTRRLKTNVKAWDVVYHGEVLVPVEQTSGTVAHGGARFVAYYRRDNTRVLIPAGLGNVKSEAWNWKTRTLSSRFCPSRCARLFSLVRSVRREALFNLDDLDAAREGMEYVTGVNAQKAWLGPGHDPAFFPSARLAFMAWWEELHGDWHGTHVVSRIELGRPLTRMEAYLLADMKNPSDRMLYAKGMDS